MDARETEIETLEKRLQALEDEGASHLVLEALREKLEDLRQRDPSLLRG